MIKLILKISTILAAIALIVLSYAYFNAQKLVEKFKPEIETQLSLTLGSQVTLSELKVSLFPSIYLAASGLKIDGEENNRSHSGIQLEEVRFKLSLAALLSGTIKVNELALIKPTLVAYKSGSNIGIRGLKPPQTKITQSAPATSAQMAEVEQAQTTGIPASLDFEKISLTDGKITLEGFTEKNSPLGEKIAIKELNFFSQLSGGANKMFLQTTLLSGAISGERSPSSLNFQFNVPSLEFDLATKILSIPAVKVTLLDQIINLSLTSQLSAGQNINKEFNAKVNINSFALSSLNQLDWLVPPLQKLNLSGAFSSEIIAKLSGNSIESKGSLKLESIALNIAEINLSQINGEVALTLAGDQAQAASKGIKLIANQEELFSKFESTFQFSQKLLKLKSFELEGLAGVIKANSSLSLINRKRFDLAFSSNNIDLNRAIKTLAPKVPAMLDSGTLAQLDGRFDGELNSVDLIKSISGTSSILVRNCSLKGINVAGDVLRKVKGLPFISASLFEEVPENEKSAISSSETQLQSLSGSFQVTDAVVTTPDLNLVSQQFTLNANGKIALDKSVNLKSTILFSPAFSKSLTSRSDSLKQILDKEGRLIVPLVIQGTLPKPLILPNIEQLAKSALSNRLKSDGEKLLDKALGDSKGKKNPLKGITDLF